MAPSYDEIAAKLNKSDQAHLLTFHNSLPDAEKASLLDQLDRLNVERVNRICQKALKDVEALQNADPSQSQLQPLPDSAFASLINADKAQAAKWEEEGLKQIADGKVAAIVMAGGQGTRLGSSDPKGCYDIQLPSHKSLFQLQAERIKRLQVVAAQRFPKSGAKEAVLPWYIMTSGPTRPATEAFFKKHNFFGLDQQHVIFFEQGTLPCFTFDGKIILDGKSQLSAAPDGNGGVYAALKTEGVLADLDKRGIKYIHAYCVDNCLCKVADPIFIGHCVLKGADCGAKVVPKASWDESVGVVCLKNKKFSVVEYSEISEANAKQTNPQTGALAYNAGNIANHFYTTDFLKRVESFEHELEYHVAKKKIPHVDLSTGQTVKPSSPNGIKLELFIFDVFPFTKNMAVLEVSRKEEFSPLKNAPGTASDNPETSRRDIIAQQARFVEAAGGHVVPGKEEEALKDADGSAHWGKVTFEISPLVTYAGEGLKEHVSGKTITTPAVVSSVEDLKKFAK